MEKDHNSQPHPYSQQRDLILYVIKAWSDNQTEFKVDPEEVLDTYAAEVYDEALAATSKFNPYWAGKHGADPVDPTVTVADGNSGTIIN